MRNRRLMNHSSRCQIELHCSTHGQHLIGHAAREGLRPNIGREMRSLRLGRSTTIMQLTRITTFEQLQALARDWNRLAGGVPFRSWQWMHAWWRHYGSARNDSTSAKALYVLAVHDASGQLVGVAPWFIERSVLAGNTVRTLGAGEVCSDYLSVLVEPENRTVVTDAIAGWLAETHAAECFDHWDTIDLDGVAADDEAVASLAEACRQRGLKVRQQPGPNFWRLELPATWEDYLANLSKSHRKQLRRLERRSLDRDHVRVHQVRTQDDLTCAWPVFEHLHQLRRQAKGQRGCFASRRFESFQDLAVGQLLDAGWLRLDILEMDGQPVAAEYDLAMGDVVYAYQSGMDTDRLADEPGRVLQMAILQRAIRKGRSAVDFLRGDEPYKAHWRAKPRPSVQVRIAPNRISTNLRTGIYDAGAGVKQWIKSGLTTAGLYSS